MIKTRFTADLGNGQTATRTSSSLTYTHAVVIRFGTEKASAFSWHTTERLAQVGLTCVPRFYDWSVSLVVPVKAEQILPKRTSAADKNAARRGVISRRITQYREYLARAEATLATWDGGNAEHQKARLVRDFGEERGLELHASLDRETRRAPIFAREQIAKLERERAALLAAKAEG